MRRRVVLAAGAAAFGALAGPQSASASSRRRIVVAADGRGDVTTVQAAVDAVPAGNAEPFVIDVRPGVYHGQVIVPVDRPHIVLRGLGRDPADVVVTDDRANGTPKPGGGTWGTSGSASVTLDGADFTAENLTLSNSFDEAAHPEITARQAVAVLTRADRIAFRGVRFVGNQDTLYVNSRTAATVARVALDDCYVEGDVDFIFGRATAAFTRCHIHSLDRGSDSNNGYVTAASTSIGNPYGLLFDRCRFTGDAAPGTVFLGRPWHPSNDPDAIGQTVIRDSVLGAHVKAAPWTDFGSWPWREARYFEYRNRGPGADVNDDRPQLTREQAGAYTPTRVLSGADGWRPFC